MWCLSIIYQLSIYHLSIYYLPSVYLLFISKSNIYCLSTTYHLSVIIYQLSIHLSISMYYLPRDRHLTIPPQLHRVATIPKAVRCWVRWMDSGHREDDPKRHRCAGRRGRGPGERWKGGGEDDWQAPRLGSDRSTQHLPERLKKVGGMPPPGLASLTWPKPFPTVTS